MMVLRGGGEWLCENMTFDEDKGGGGHTTPKMYDIIYG